MTATKTQTHANNNTHAKKKAKDRFNKDKNRQQLKKRKKKMEVNQTLDQYEQERLNELMRKLWLWRESSTTTIRYLFHWTPEERKQQKKLKRAVLYILQNQNSETADETAPETGAVGHAEGEPFLNDPDTGGDFGQTHFGGAQLDDRRRTRRLAISANILLSHPSGTLPDKFASPNDLCAFYDLCARDEVTHQRVLAPHVLYTLAQIAMQQETVLVVHDSTELDYTTHSSLENLGQIGSGSRRGYIAHNSLAVDPSDGSALGLTGQILHCRQPAPEKETTAEKRERESRESRLWLRGVGGLPSDWRIVDVCDRGADTFEFLSHEWHSGRRFVVRVKSKDRLIRPGHDDQGEVMQLESHLGELKPWNRKLWKVQVQETEKHPARTAWMHVAAAPVTLQLPNNKSGEYPNERLPMWAVRIWEPNPPKGVQAAEWILYTNEPITRLEDIRRVKTWYEYRWVVEELHKGMKTGCEIQNMQFTHEDRLSPAIGLLSVVAWKLLNLRDLARRADARRTPATEVMSSDYVLVLSEWRHGKERLDWTLHDFFYALARLGGHQNRKQDKQPGWLVLWRGWMKLHQMVTAARPKLKKIKALEKEIEDLKSEKDKKRA